MKKTKSIGVLVAMAFVAGIAAFSTHANGQEQPAKPEAAGPPEWVLEAWETGEAPVVPAIGPPAWVVEAWENGERPQRLAGPPPWIAKRHEMAKELGLPGPPTEVIEAWENGEGFEFPGPPDFVLDLLGF